MFGESTYKNQKFAPTEWQLSTAVRQKFFKTSSMGLLFVLKEQAFTTET